MMNRITELKNALHEIGYRLIDIHLIDDKEAMITIDKIGGEILPDFIADKKIIVTLTRTGEKELVTEDYFKALKKVLK